jgi:plasmid stabilization system protein ParE
LYRVELTASFLERLDAIEAVLVEADAGVAFVELLAELRATVIPNLRRFPRIGRGAGAVGRAASRRTGCAA